MRATIASTATWPQQSSRQNSIELKELHDEIADLKNKIRKQDRRIGELESRIIVLESGGCDDVDGDTADD